MLWQHTKVTLLCHAWLKLARTVIAGTFPDFGYAPPAGWTGQRFALSQDYPTQLPDTEAVPWAAIDYVTPQGVHGRSAPLCV